MADGGEQSGYLNNPATFARIKQAITQAYLATGRKLPAATAMNRAVNLIVTYPDVWRQYSPNWGDPDDVQAHSVLLAYAAALDEIDDPSLRVSRLLKEAQCAFQSADWHVVQSKERRDMAAARSAVHGSNQLSVEFLEAAVAHSECAARQVEEGSRLVVDAANLQVEILTAQSIIVDLAALLSKAAKNSSEKAAGGL